MKPIAIWGCMALFAMCSSQALLAQENELTGRWDLEVEYDGRWAPAWLEVEASGNKALVGRFVSLAGSARPIAEVHQKDGLFSFSIPPQWIGSQYMHLTGTVNQDAMEGHILDHMGHPRAFRGVRAPKLLYPAPEEWTKPRPLIAKGSLEGWTTTPGSGPNQWVVENGVLKSPASGANLMTTEAFMDFKLHVEFRYPEHSNSGIYLRGRYEVQVEDSYGKEPNSHFLGGVYGFLTPNENAAAKPGEWQSYDITLVGRRITVVANGKTIIHNQIIPGITGGALDSREGEPGPIYLQGDHGPVEYRNMTISVPK
ncbi:DUF1080 domain-containing protein [Robiginitalea sp. M366]|uniref:3-keto-disaccharide hydrolase n=1 Tax=Robiginitalea aestuariiviva TaxID=3036903 RepID=UPI00240CFC33|nr:DUF1080 domain-containing protein [Robiginitalea aestuariiviva]MDG1571257.1 DUF1080 domain-containing protein [Robiginitalea aestuariiviva]